MIAMARMPSRDSTRPLPCGWRTSRSGARFRVRSDVREKRRASCVRSRLWARGRVGRSERVARERSVERGRPSDCGRSLRLSEALAPDCRLAREVVSREARREGRSSAWSSADRCLRVVRCAIWVPACRISNACMIRRFHSEGNPDLRTINSWVSTSRAISRDKSGQRDGAIGRLLSCVQLWV